MKITCGGARGKDGCADESFSVIEILARPLRCATQRAKKRPARKGRVASVGLSDWVRLGGMAEVREEQKAHGSQVLERHLGHPQNPDTKTEVCASDARAFGELTEYLLCCNNSILKKDSMMGMSKCKVVLGTTMSAFLALTLHAAEDKTKEAAAKE